MKIRRCTTEDVPELAVMNKSLIEDEKSTNPMNLEELGQRMEGFLAGEYDAYYFMMDDAVIGYALVRKSSTPLYLRQFFIKRQYRRRHYGKEAFSLLLDELAADTIELDVLPWNEAGLLFWKDCGLQETCISMKYSR